MLKRHRTASLVLMVLSLTLGAMAAPQIVCDAPVWEFPKVKEGEVTQHEFMIKNGSETEDLEIKRVRASCGCTAATIGEKLLKPGQTTQIDIKFNTLGRSGKQTKYIYVYSNDPQSSMLKLTVKGEVEKVPAPKISVRPYSWNLKTLEPGKTVRTTVTVLNIGDKPLEIKSVSTSSDNLKARILGPKTLEPKGRSNVELSFMPDYKSMRIRESITFQSNDPRRKKYVFNVFGKLELDNRGVTVSILGSREKGDDIEVDLHINNSKAFPATVQIPDALDSEPRTIKARSMEKLSVKIPASKLKSGDAQGLKNLKVEITLPLKNEKSEKGQSATKTSKK